MAGPLQDLLVVDCSRGVVGGRASGLLADYGADVIWVEPPGGDPCRRDFPAMCSVFNRGKRSVIFDLTEASDRDQVFRLIDRADIFMEAWEPGGAERSGLGWAEVHDRNPRLVYGSISGFGQEGPWRDQRGYEAIVHSLIGSMGEQLGHREGPIFQGLPFAGTGASCLAVIGLLAAVYRRYIDSIGRWVETSMLDGALAYLSVFWGESDESVEAIEAGELRDKARFGTSSVGQRLITRSFQCSDGTYLGIHTGAVGGFGRLMEVLGLSDRIPPSLTGMDMGVPLEADQTDIVMNEIPGIFAKQPRDHWVQEVLEADVCAIEHLSPCECFDQAQPIHNKMIIEIDDPILGVVQQVAPAATLSTADHEINRPAPTPGQHTDEVIRLISEVPPASPERRSPLGDPPALLDGVKILDFGAYYAGPYSSRLLADLGADVIKLEPPAGDQPRGIERCFYSAQAGKRSLAANLKDPDMAALAQGILAWADVVHHNLRPGASERLGLGYEEYRVVRPHGVYMHSPGWGSSGPNRDRQSFAPMLSGYAGVTFEVAGQFNPPLPPLGHEDPGNGLLGAVATLFALIHRQRTGEGSYVENPQLNATMAHMAHIVRTQDGAVIGAGALDPLQMGHSATERLYETSDGWVCVAAFDEAERSALTQAAGLDRSKAEQCSTRESIRERDYELMCTLASFFGSRSTSEAFADLNALGVPTVVPSGHNIHNYMNDEATRSSGRVVECVHPVKGRIREIGHLIRFSDSEVAPHRLAPSWGSTAWRSPSSSDMATHKLTGSKNEGHSVSQPVSTTR